MDCEAYAVFYPKIMKNTEEERLKHISNIKKFVKKMSKTKRFSRLGKTRQISLRKSKLRYHGYLIHLDGTVETVV